MSSKSQSICKIRLRSGPNIGKKCYEVNTICSHPKYNCEFCDYQSSYSSTLKTHMTKCKNKPKKLKVHIKKKYTEPPSQPPPPTQAQLEYINSALHDELRAIRREVREIRDKPSIINNINIAVMAPNFYDELVHRMGENSAVGFLTSATMNNQPINILKELYFNNVNPTQFPIASHNGRYRYLNESGEIVDTSKQDMVESISKKLHNAMILASSKLIKFSQQNDDVARLYDVYDIGTIQANLTSFKLNDMEKDLAMATENPSHPFFENDVNVIYL